MYAVDAWTEEVSAWRSSVIAELPSPLFDDFMAQIAKADVEEIVTPVRSLTALAADSTRVSPWRCSTSTGITTKRPRSPTSARGAVTSPTTR